MTAELVIAGEETRRLYRAQTYPFIFARPTSPAGCTATARRIRATAAGLRARHHASAYRVRCQRIPQLPDPGQAYGRLSPFGANPGEQHPQGQQLPIVSAAGLWRLAEEALEQLLRLHDGGLAHGDAELQTSSSAGAARAHPDRLRGGGPPGSHDGAAWDTRCALDLEPLLREAVFLQCALGRQPVDSVSCRGNGCPPCFDRRIAFASPSRCKQRRNVELSTRKDLRNSTETPRNVSAHWKDLCSRRRNYVPSGHSKALKAVRHSEFEEEINHHERKIGPASSDHGGTNYKHTAFPRLQGQPRASLFGSNVFGLATMKAQLPKEVFRSVKRTIEADRRWTRGGGRGRGRDEGVGARQGATHYAHVFYPLTGLSAAKQDSFLSPDGEGGAITEFAARRWSRASRTRRASQRRIRATSEARGYTAWDVTSLPTTRERRRHHVVHPDRLRLVDRRGARQEDPLLRSGQALNTHVTRVLKLFGHEKPAMVSRTRARTGILPHRQELLLRAARPAERRPRAVWRAPTKGQEFEDHYFGVIPSA